MLVKLAPVMPQCTYLFSKRSFVPLYLVEMATVVDEPDDGRNHSFVSTKPLDDGGHHGLVGGRVQPEHLGRGQSDLRSVSPNHYYVDRSKKLETLYLVKIKMFYN